MSALFFILREEKGEVILDEKGNKKEFFPTLFDLNYNQILNMKQGDRLETKEWVNEISKLKPKTIYIIEEIKRYDAPLP
ncbi:MAG: hypothetical protein JW791_04970 [Nanoarchaeota archaeon]|nr:hypothetical protein [Nanoarchaeota archaeon]